MQEIPTGLHVVAVALVRPDGRFLLQQRAPGKAHAGLWEFPGGKVEAGESAPLALIREIAEELDVTVAEADLAYLARASDGAAGIVIDLYTCRRWQGEPRCLDAAALCWRGGDELGDLAMPPLDVPLAQALIGWLKKAN